MTFKEALLAVAVGVMVYRFRWEASYGGVIFLSIKS